MKIFEEGDSFWLVVFVLGCGVLVGCFYFGEHMAISPTKTASPKPIRSTPTFSVHNDSAATPPEPTTAPVSNTEETPRISAHVVRTERQQITSSSWCPRIFLQNDSDAPLSYADVPVQAYDSSGIMISQGTAHFLNVPPHTTAMESYFMTIEGQATLKIGAPSTN